MDHVWRVFENDKEYLFKNFKLEVPSQSEMSPGPDWNITCQGFMTIDRETSTAIIKETLGGPVGAHTESLKK
jgi:hypothetical protein